MGCKHQVHGPNGEPGCEPQNMRCVEVPMSKCRELYEGQKEESQKDGISE
jgi:hypothetical protein